ncbi:rhodanese-like domain-containing protein, partial [Gammaproteobacteria bacterium]|nr:rhodanese-like domain-containing protein [Gammaproteobacteria bacterium]
MNLIIKLILLSFSIYSYSLTIIDVRTPEEWNTGYLKSAINVEWQNITSIESLISKDEEIYLY